MEISERERGILQKIVTEDSFAIMKRIADALVIKWNKNPINRESEWSAVNDALSREERRIALITYIETIEKLAYDK